MIINQLFTEAIEQLFGGISTIWYSRLFILVKLAFSTNILLRYTLMVGSPSTAVFHHLQHHMVTFLLSYGMLKIMSTEPDLNQRPRDIWFCVWSTVSRSTNWAIGGCDFFAPISPYSRERNIHTFLHIQPYEWGVWYFWLLYFIHAVTWFSKLV